MSTRTEGIVIIREIASLDEQLKLINLIMKNSKLKDTNGNWNMKSRGRYFSKISKYPDEDAEYLKNCAQKFKTEVEKLDSSLSYLDVTHMLTLVYPSTQGIGWHRDSYGGNDGDEGAPVYSFTLGNSCIFEYKLVNTKDVISVTLNSGDIIVFGGPQRLMWHRVKTVIKGSFDGLGKSENFDVRINLTLRTCTNFTDEQELEYQTENYVKRLAEKWNKTNY